MTVKKFVLLSVVYISCYVGTVSLYELHLDKEKKSAERFILQMNKLQDSLSIERAANNQYRESAQHLFDTTIVWIGRDGKPRSEWFSLDRFGGEFKYQTNIRGIKDDDGLHTVFRNAWKDDEKRPGFFRFTLLVLLAESRFGANVKHNINNDSTMDAGAFGLNDKWYKSTGLMVQDFYIFRKKFDGERFLDLPEQKWYIVYKIGEPEARRKGYIK